MPIVQDRIIAIINAGLDYKNAIEHVFQQIAYYHHEVEAKRLDPEVALDYIHSMHIAGVLKHPDISPMTLLVERKHYADNMARNNRQARRQRIKRGKDPEAGVERPDPNRLLPSSQAKGPFGAKGVPVDQRPEVALRPTGFDYAAIAREMQGKTTAEIKLEVEAMRAKGALPEARLEGAELEPEPETPMPLPEPKRHPDDNEKDWSPEDDLAIDIGEPEAQP